MFIPLFVLSLIVMPFMPVEAAFAEPDKRGNVETEVKVLGLCGMCKDRIEKAAYSVRGVSMAEWNQEKQMLKLKYKASRTNQETIERAIAKVGHDTENFITDEETYANLHHCCKYPRDPEMLKNNKLYNEE